MAKARVGFRIHAMIYVLVNLFLAAVWYVTNPAHPWPPTLQGGEAYYWPIWPLLGWGLGLLIHGFVTYGGGKDWERREAEKLRRRMSGP